MYQDSELVEYSWGQDATFGATTVLHYIVGPKGKVGFVRDLMCDVTTSLVGTTTVPEIQVGISSGDTTYGRYRLGSTAILGYGTGPRRASLEPGIVGNPPRNAQDFANHVTLDGYPLGSSGSLTGGSSTTVNPAGRILASSFKVTNVVSGTGSVCRLTLAEPIGTTVTGQLVVVQGVVGATGANTNAAAPVAISALNTANNWIELSGTTFGGTYTSGGVVNIVTVITCGAGVGGTPAGGGHVRVKIQWIGPNAL